MSEIRVQNIGRQICMDEQVYYDLLNGVVTRLKAINMVANDPWITADEAMRILKISPQTTLKKFADQKQFKVSKVTEKIVLYHRPTLLQFIERKVQ